MESLLIYLISMLLLPFLTGHVLVVLTNSCEIVRGRYLVPGGTRLVEALLDSTKEKIRFQFS